MKVGQRIKKLRQVRGMSQRELAKAVNLPNSTLSMIERDAVSPSISNLHKILTGLEMPLSHFFTHDFNQGEKVVYHADELQDIGSGGLQYLLVGADKQDRQLTFLIETYPPHSGTGDEWMTHEGHEAGTVLEGEITILQNDQEYHLKAGDSYYLNTQLPHQFINRGANACRLVSAVAPASF
ncbi:cupin domain-containing protein [Lacimicrobium alkaliphilum]|uniref:XRE family transcriptional regulator n=1 Tax=Lacimicrobium alkaliphilum TaxID=1526571 RepID=A0ABQ1RDC9_9ALTE|nr:cupin domain-containing protein [Lacimicrobium alkaliphilum]GGD63110.1 XRE family transcriptional regulator [Lacimicrobium alkaliphilum]